VSAFVYGSPLLISNEVDWWPLLAPVDLVGDALNEFAIDAAARTATHVRLNIFPDGGVARLRVHGIVVPNERDFDGSREVDLAATERGGFVISCSDMHYGDRQNLILPGRSTHMGDGWETKRRRGQGTGRRSTRSARRYRRWSSTPSLQGNAPGACVLRRRRGEDASLFDVQSAHWRH
jgi:allantoicase